MKSNFGKCITAAFALLVTLGYNACDGGFQIAGVTESASTGRSDDSRPKTPDLTSLKECIPNNRGIANFASRRLTKTEILNSFTTLFGPVYMSRPAVAAAALSIPDDSSAHEKSQFDPILQSSHLESVMGLSEAVVIEFRDFKQDFYGPCVRDAVVTKTCFTNYIKTFGKRAWRRPLTNAEIDSFATAFWVGGPKSFDDAMHALLTSPEFLLILETRAGTGERKRISSYEVATRISFLTTSSIPDGILLAAADKGELATIAQVKAQVNRLLLTTAGKDGIVRSIIRYVGSENITDPSSIAGIAQGLPGGTTLNPNPTIGMGRELKQELVDFISYIVFEKNGSYNDLMTSPTVFPKTARLAAVYGTSVWTAGQPPINAPADERAGIWTRAGVLSTTAGHTKPFARGVNFRKRILCQSLPSPDPSVIASRDDLINSLSPLDFSNREIHTVITSSNSCMGCHSQINPVGFGLERYNELGSFRKSELVLDNRGKVLKTHPVDFVVQLQLAYNQDPVTVSGTEDFIKTLTGNPIAQSCFAETLFVERRYRNVADSDSCTLASLATNLSNQKPILSILTESIANEDIFWNGSK